MSPTGHPAPQPTPQDPATPVSAQRPPYVLNSEWDSSSGKVRDDVFGQRVSDLMARDAEAQIRKQSLPTAPDKYEVKLPADFKAPADVKFELDNNDPLLGRARELAHQRGLTQEEFSDFLGVYAASKIGEQQHLATARDAQMALLGSAANQRIDAVETWLKARVGVKADGIVAQLKNFPVAAYVEAFEEIVRQFSHQGSSQPNNSNRAQQENNGEIPGYAGMTFEQKRAAQDVRNGRVIQPTGRMAAGGR